MSVTAISKCPHCDWSARMTGNSTIEVGMFLVARLAEHVENDCPSPEAARLRFKTDSTTSPMRGESQ